MKLVKPTYDKKIETLVKQCGAIGVFDTDNFKGNNIFFIRL